MKKARFFLLVVMLSVLVTGVFAAKKLRFMDVLELDIYKGTSYLQLATGDFDEGFTTTPPSGFPHPAAITDASGYPYALYTYSGSSYYPVYSTSEW
jgi:hypothetical protein